MSQQINTANNEKNFLPNNNPLATLPLGSLITKFAIPSIIAMLVTGLYNIVDQIFIGNYVGELGNAATNIAFPLSTMCTAVSLLLGIGGAAAFNLKMGAGEHENAGKYIGNSISVALITGLVLFAIAQLFLNPMLLFFGSSDSILPYAAEYTRITSIGFPFVILTVTGGHLIRADGKPAVAMTCNLTGAIINIVLDTLFVAVFKWGMTGAAAATVIGQIIGASIAAYHLMHFSTIKLIFSDFIPDIHYFGHSAKLGMSQGFNQIAMMIVQIVLNNTLKHYGAASVYGSDIPIAVVGISSKLAMLYFSICIGLSHALQPISSFNYGAKNYARVKEAFSKTRNAGTVASITAFLLFQLFPRQIIGLFGHGSELYFDFAVRYLRIYMFFTFINNVQPLVSNFFSAIGKPHKGLFLSLTRQLIFLLPLIVVLPLIWGIDGLMYAGLVADGMAFAVSLIFIVREFSRPEYKNHKDN